MSYNKDEERKPPLIHPDDWKNAVELLFDETIAEYHMETKNSKKALYINDKIKLYETDNEYMNKILIEIVNLDRETHKKIDSAPYFMTLEEARLLKHKVLNRELVNNQFARAKGKDGKARAITIKGEYVKDDKNQSNKLQYMIKIDKGIGKARQNGMTTFSQKVDDSFIFYLDEEPMQSMVIEIDNRINMHQTAYINLQQLAYFTHIRNKSRNVSKEKGVDSNK